MVALVTADLESHLVAVDADSGSHPEADPDRARAHAASRRASSGRRSSPTRRTAGSASSTPPGSTSSAEIGGLGEPRYTAMHPSERLAYVSDSKRESVVVVDLARRAVVAQRRRSRPGAPSLAQPGRGALWVALGSTAGAIAVLDTADPRRPVAAPHDRTAVPRPRRRLGARRRAGLGHLGLARPGRDLRGRHGAGRSRCCRRERRRSTSRSRAAAPT